MEYGHFDDQHRTYVITNPTPPRAWINYMGNGRMGAFISQGAGGCCWYLEAESRRLTRYHYLASPSDRPGFYVYVKDRRTGQVWNPHYAPTCTPLDKYECRHEPGLTSFVSEKDGIRVAVDYVVPMDDDMLVWKVTATNLTGAPADLQFASYLEFGILEVHREPWWCYLKYHFSLSYDPAMRCIRNDYNVFESLYAPRMVVGCTADVTAYECSRDEFIGRSGSLENPAALKTPRGFTNSELPVGGHGCGVLASDMKLAPGETKQFAYIFAIGDEWKDTDAKLKKYSDLSRIDAARAAIREHWESRLSTLQTQTGDEMVDRFINTWIPYQSLTLLKLPGMISTDHQAAHGLRYRDSTQFALAAGNMDPNHSADMLGRLFATQKTDGMGCCSFYPHTSKPPVDVTRRSDNTVWQIYTLKNIVEETGDLSYLARTAPWREGGSATFYEHTLRGLDYLWEHRGPQGLPLLYYADWNDCLNAYQSDVTESVMLGMQLAYSYQQFKVLAERLGRDKDAAWCQEASDKLVGILNSDAVWDGQWYRRLLMGEGKSLGNKDDKEGKIWINAQTWAVICGAGRFEDRGQVAMESVRRHLDTPVGLAKQWPAFGSTRLESGERFFGMRPGIGEYGGIFNHTNTWAIIAETMLGHNERAFDYFRRMIPAVVAEKFGFDHYLREPYVYVSAVVGPASKAFGQGGISWITGTANWMYLTATQYILGIKPTLDGLRIAPALPGAMKNIRIQRRFRGCQYDIQIDNAARGRVQLEVNGKPIDGDVVPVQKTATCAVRCLC